jgi:hypothetical protein
MIGRIEPESLWLFFVPASFFSPSPATPLEMTHELSHTVLLVANFVLGCFIWHVHCRRKVGAIER